MTALVSLLLNSFLRSLFTNFLILVINRLGIYGADHVHSLGNSKAATHVAVDLQCWTL